MVDPDVTTYYGLGLEESRLFVDGHPSLEYVRTVELLERLLPPAPARILDVGGGTGVYAFPLCERGYTVQLVDPVALHVDRANEIAREQNLAQMTAILGDARDLASSGTGTGYDAVLLLGPLYHLTDRKDRTRAFAEAIRVAKPGGVVVAVGISRFASLIDGLRHGLLDDAVFRRIVEGDLRDGQHRNPDMRARPEFFTTAYFHHPDELEAEARDAGLRDVRLYAIEGPSWILDKSADLDSQLFAARATESERALMAATAHMMVVGNRE